MHTPCLNRNAERLRTTQTGETPCEVQSDVREDTSQNAGGFSVASSYPSRTFPTLSALWYQAWRQLPRLDGTPRKRYHEGVTKKKKKAGCRRSSHTGTHTLKTFQALPRQQPSCSLCQGNKTNARTRRARPARRCREPTALRRLGHRHGGPRLGVQQVRRCPLSPRLSPRRFCRPPVWGFGIGFIEHVWCCCEVRLCSCEWGLGRAFPCRRGARTATGVCTAHL